MDKKQLRQEMKQKLALLNKPNYEEKSYLIAQRLYQDSDWITAKTVGITVSNPPEVDTYQIIRKAWEQGKTVVVPKCEPKTKLLQFRKLDRFSQLESVFFGLYEPIESVTDEVTVDEIDLLIVPGLAFLEKGYRLGFGGGYYDRFLKDYQGNKLSLAFDLQLVEHLPIETHDQPVPKIITDRQVIVTYD
ncbi:5-formyltetrahydrofolate cyclo-ligase [Neobacillus sp. LXY-4]|uniref:5-formyltetrahydrofolate cyclo-ligase n=1 Tax=Neobacillus sp. LXY-4 TaxID=3379826 RepID=UPI003EE41414